MAQIDTTINGSTATLEIVQNGTTGWAVNLPSIDDCIGHINYGGADRYTATTKTGEPISAHGTRRAALAAVTTAWAGAAQ